MNKVKDYARKRKLDNTVQRNTQHGSDPMDVGAAHDPWEHNNDWDEEEIDAVGYYGNKGKGK